MVIGGKITSNGEPSAYTGVFLSNSKGDSLGYGMTTEENGWYKIDTSKIPSATHITFASGGDKKLIPISSVSCNKYVCDLDVNLSGSTMKELVVTPKNDKTKKNTLRNVILISVPLLLVAGIFIYYKTKK